MRLTVKAAGLLDVDAGDWLPLDQMMKKKPLPLPVAFEIGMGVIAGLSHAHTHGVLHRSDVAIKNGGVSRTNGRVLHNITLRMFGQHNSDMLQFGYAVSCPCSGR